MNPSAQRKVPSSTGAAFAAVQVSLQRFSVRVVAVRLCSIAPMTSYNLYPFRRLLRLVRSGNFFQGCQGRDSKSQQWGLAADSFQFPVPMPHVPLN